MEKLIQKIINEILKKTKPCSIFLYGSYVSGDYIPGVSDFEIGVIRRGDKDVPFVRLREVATKFSRKKLNLRIYPYDLKKLKDGSIDTPFTRNVFIRHLILTSKTIWGEKVIENLELPPITVLDAYRESCFSTMSALRGLFLLRKGLIKDGLEAGYKACLFATLSLEYLLGEFPVGFGNIVKTSKKLELDDEWRNLIKNSLKIRNGKLRLNKEKATDFVFNVITYCNQVVEPKIMIELEKGNRVVVE